MQAPKMERNSQTYCLMVANSHRHDTLANHYGQPQPDMVTHLLEIQDKKTNTLQRQQSSIDQYIRDLETCTGDFSVRIIGFYQLKKVSKLTGCHPKDICFERKG